MGFQSLADLRTSGMRMLQNKRMSAHDHSGDAVSTLCGLLFDERVLQGSGLLDGTQSLHGGDLFTFEPAHRGDAGEDRFTIDYDRAGAALTYSAAVLGRIEL
jgi:hypothetical protein